MRSMWNIENQMMIFIMYFRVVKYIAQHGSQPDQQNIITDENCVEKIRYFSPTATFPACERFESRMDGLHSGSNAF